MVGPEERREDSIEDTMQIYTPYLRWYREGERQG